VGSMADSLLRGSSGINLARQMKRAKPKVPIVMLSGDPPEHLGHVDCYINKAEKQSQFPKCWRSFRI
jgi:FixJ family two-component response regulator